MDIVNGNANKNDGDAKSFCFTTTIKNKIDNTVTSSMISISVTFHYTFSTYSIWGEKLSPFQNPSIVIFIRPILLSLALKNTLMHCLNGEIYA